MLAVPQPPSLSHVEYRDRCVPFKKNPPIEEVSEPTTGPMFGMLEVLSVRPIMRAEFHTGSPVSRYSSGDPATVLRNAPPLASLPSDIFLDLLAWRARRSLPSSTESFGITGEVPLRSAEPTSTRLRAGWFDWTDFELLAPVMKA